MQTQPSNTEQHNKLRNGAPLRKRVVYVEPNLEFLQTLQ